MIAMGQFTAGLLQVPLKSVANPSVNVLDAPLPREFGTQSIRFPNLASVRAAFVPNPVGSLPVIREMVQPGTLLALPKPKLSVRVEPSIVTIQPSGVDDPEGSGIARRAALAGRMPAVIGEPVQIGPSCSARAEQVRTLPLRLPAPREAGIFIPRLRMGTLRPRMAFGPIPSASDKSAADLRMHGHRDQKDLGRPFAVARAGKGAR
jgi:hypothetical protein